MRPGLEVFETSRKPAPCLGLRTRESIPRGGFVGHYRGKLKMEHEVETSDRDAPATQKTYAFNLGDWAARTDATRLLSVDARHFGNALRFANDSRGSVEPNCDVVHILSPFEDARTPRFHVVCMFAARDVAPGEELLYDYGGRLEASVYSRGNIVLNEDEFLLV